MNRIVVTGASSMIGAAIRVQAVYWGGITGRIWQIDA